MRHSENAEQTAQTAAVKRKVRDTLSNSDFKGGVRLRNQRNVRLVVQVVNMHVRLAHNFFAERRAHALENVAYNTIGPDQPAAAAAMSHRRREG
mmetsp:Transcript_8052/g.25110  ORF Transcript_8052/g.25110 Transcript_8052/m.25110 type:complete len:94 (+) Transcript_8052:421-702(+)